MGGEAKIAKKAIRTKIIAQRNTLDAAWIATASAAIVQRVAVLGVYLESQTVCLFSALTDEVHLGGLHTDSLAVGRRVLLPAWRANERTYGFKEWAANTVLHSAHWGVPEPDVTEFAELYGKVCMIVPGLAFDMEGGRIGYGAGHYDRLVTMPVLNGSIVSVGVCFDFQVQEASLPKEPWDQSMHFVVTERRTLVCRQAKD